MRSCQETGKWYHPNLLHQDLWWLRFWYDVCNWYHIMMSICSHVLRLLSRSVEEEAIWIRHDRLFEWQENIKIPFVVGIHWWQCFIHHAFRNKLTWMMRIQLACWAIDRRCNSHRGGHAHNKQYNKKSHICISGYKSLKSCELCVLGYAQLFIFKELFRVMEWQH